MSAVPAVLVANGCNLGLAAMARSSGFSPRQLAWTQNWYFRDATVTAANTLIVNHQHAHPLAKTWGTGTLSSSDGQRFPFTVRNPTARAMRRYYTRTGGTIYTWTSDQHTQYGTRVIPTTIREATYVLDAILDNETDLDIDEHTAGYTDLIFGLFDLTGLTFSPRIQDLANQRLWRLPTTPTNTPAAQLLRHRINPQRFHAHSLNMAHRRVSACKSAPHQRPTSLFTVCHPHPSWGDRSKWTVVSIGERNGWLSCSLELR